MKRKFKFHGIRSMLEPIATSGFQNLKPLPALRTWSSVKKDLFLTTQ